MIKWERKTPLVGPSFFNGYVGDVKCFVICWALHGKYSYNVRSTLPGINEKAVADVLQGQLLCNELLENWLEEARLKIDE
jgi:hypothetical protein